MAAAAETEGGFQRDLLPVFLLRKNRKSMSVIKSILTIFLAAGFLSWSAAQSVTEKEFAEKTQLGIVQSIDMPATANQAYIEQIGDMNAALLMQSQLYPNHPNQLSLLQFGNQNMAEIRQELSGTRSEVSQVGDHNRFFLDMYGSQSDLSFIQRGNDNLMMQEYGYLYRTKLTIIQDGDQNSLIRQVTRPSSFDMTIKQIGSGIEMKVINN